MVSINSFTQNYVPFTNTKFNESLKGDMLLIGNNILNRSTTSNGPNVPYYGSEPNNNFNMQYIDVDSDATTFNSTTADLTIPATTNGCYQIKYAVLYWAGVFNTANVGNQVTLNDIDKVKFRMPGGGYNNITGTVLYNTNPVGVSGNNRPGYVSYFDVTTMLQGLPNANGTYGVANIQSGLGSNTCGGWSLFVVYEDPLATAKNITLFDGFSNIQPGDPALDIPITGFNSIPVGPVRAKLAFAALEGDYEYNGDRLRINGSSMLTPTRAANNFFNSTINDINGPFDDRNIDSSNLLGYDSGIISILNLGNGVIANNATNATVRLQTSGDAYVYFLNAFSIEVIQPQINLIKVVRDLANNDVGNQTIALGQELFYELDFQNIGNDGATNFTITDQLPLNVTFLPADLVLPPGVTYTFSGLPSNTLTFNIPNNLVTQGGANYQIRIKVKVVESCNDLRDACSNEITNQAYKTYSSLNSGNVVENQQPSASGINSCLILSPGTTNFLADIDDCIFQREEVLCGNNVTLTAGSGYTSYQWHSGSPPTAGNLISGATNQSYTVTATGTYSVVNTAPAPCLSITETFNVVDFGGIVPNPVIPYADQVDVCPVDGSDLPKIYLCGATDTQLIETNILNATLVWEQLTSTTGCGTSTPIPNCPNTSCPDANWTQVGTGPNYTAANAGEYRVRIVFQNGCFRTYYFNVYKNVFTPTVTATDIICTTPGTITVNGVPSGYEFSLDNTSSWQASNFFNNVTAGSHIVYIRQIAGGVGNCVFDIPNIQVLDRDFNVDVILNDALCNGDQGSIRVQVNNVEPQYTYELLQGTTLINNVGPINANDYTFPNLNAGTYTVNVSTSDGCTYTETVTVSDPPLLTLTAAVTIPLTCEDGEITVYPVGGTPTIIGGVATYAYEISSDPGNIYLSPNIPITAAGTYTITVTDSNNCTATTSITIDTVPAPIFTVSQTNILCYGEATGEIQFNVTNTNGYTLEYSIDNGGNFGTNPIFSNLSAGTYETIVRYTLGTAVCLTTAQTIIISEPAAALTASAGVSELAGCGPSGEGRVRITNPQGGVPSYEYSFDGGSTWVATNEAYLMPGTHTVCIRDSNDCTFCTTVTIDPAPTDPTISVDDPDFNCDGTATTTVTVNNNGGNFSYTYLLDGNPNNPPDNNVFTNVPCGDHDVTVQFERLTVPTYSNLLFEDFGEGSNTTSPGINPAYCFERQVAATQCNGSIQINDGDYAVTRRINPRFGAWVDARDHTSNGTNPNGRFLCVNIGGTAGVGGILYSKQINDIIPNQPVQASIWAMNLLVIGNTQFNPNLTIQLVRDLGLATETVIASQDTGDVPKTETWQNYILSLNPGANSSLAFVIRSNNTATSGNDVVIDDLNVFQEPVSCITEVIYPIHIDCNAAFSAQVTSSTNATCNGNTDGQITIAAQNYAPTGYYYSLTGGAPFTQVTTSPFTITGLVAGSYNLVIAYDINGTTCSFPITQVISEPNALVANAVLTSPATCSGGGVITASATGGTLNYQYQLEDNSNNILVSYQVNNVFANLTPGDYIVRVRDASGCIDPINVAINIPTPTPPTAVVSTTSDLCYDGTNAATIVVTASGGVPPYQYSINNGAFGNSNTFAGLTSNTYTIIVRDSYNCTFTMPAVTIAPQLTASAVLIKGLDCTASPDAEIAVTINGGNAPYTYQVSFNAGTLSASANVTGTTFTHIASTAGTYRFTITDAIGCTVVTNLVTVNPLPVLNPPVLVQTAFNRCNGDSNAAISVTPSGGQGPYVINIVNTTTGNNYGTQTSGLTAGIYTVTVTDANSCIATSNITLLQPDPVNFTIIKTDIQCGASGTDPGAIDVTNVTGGTAPYTYTVTNSLNSAGFPISYNTIGSEDHSFTILNFGIYTVSVVDANGCTLVSNNISIASPPNSLNIDISAATTDCTAGGTLTACVNTFVGGGPYHFALYQDLSPATPPYPTYPAWPGYQDADISDPTGLCSTFTGLTPGVTYTIIVFDETTNCYYFETAPGPIPTPSTITSVITPHNVTCTGANDGSISFTVDNFTGTGVSYQIFENLNNMPVSSVGNVVGPAPATVSNFGTLPTGSYYILFTEVGGPNAGCSQTSTAFTISESPVLLSLTATVIKNDNCNVNAGQISVTGLNGTPAYSYQIVTAGSPAPTQATWAGQASNVFNVEGGSYDVYIMDANGCIQSATSIFVPTDSTPNISLTLDAATLCNTTDGNYTVTVTRDNTVGIAPFTYSVDGSAFTTYTEDVAFSFQLTNLNAGTHTVIVRDVNGCTETETITILPPLNNTLLSSLAATLDCGATDGVITVNASGGSGSTNYTYTISPNTGITLTNNVFSNVAAGFYTVTITDNVTNCSINSSITLVQPTAPTFNTTVTGATCNLGSDGTITVNLTGTNTDPVYMYAITSGPVTFVQQSSNVFTGLTAGSYDVEVTSGRNCVTTQTVIVGEATPIIIPAPVVTEFACNTGSNSVNNATIVVNGVTGGSGTYTNYEFLDASNTILQWGTSNTYVEANVLGGTYTINVYDDNGCFATTTATINPFIRISNPTVTVTNPITCTNTEDITINIATTGGTPTTLNYSVVALNTGNTYNVTQTNNPNFSGLIVGNYQITVENATTGCSVQTIHYVFSPNTFVVNATVNNNVTCFGGNDGSVSFTFVDQNLTPTNDAGPFSYVITNTVTLAVVSSGSSPNAGPFTVPNLPAGTYQLQTTLDGSPFCPATTNFTITQPITALALATSSTPISCVPAADGTISAVGSHGWGAPYQYQLVQGTILVDWSSQATFTGLIPGTYTVNVRDNIGCIVTTDVTLNAPTPIDATISASTTMLACIGDTNATITVNGTTGGFGSGYLYILTNTIGGQTSGPQTSNIFNNVGAGNYTVTVTDSFNCTFTTTSVTINQPTENVIASLSTVTQQSCVNSAQLELSASGGTAPYRYSTNPAGPFTTPLTGGNVTITVPFVTTPTSYQYYVVDANNCIIEVSNAVVVTPLDEVLIDLDLSEAVILCTNTPASDFGKIVATATGGVGNYVFTLNPATAGVLTTVTGNQVTYTNVPSGVNYSVSVTSGDCSEVSNSFDIVAPIEITFTTQVSQISCPDEAVDGSIIVTPSGGSPPYQYSISSNPFETVNSGVFTNLGPGNYTIKIIDSNGCFKQTAVITIDPIDSFGFIVYNIVDEVCINEGGSAEFQIEGGTQLGGSVTTSEGYNLHFNGAVINSVSGLFNSTNVPSFGSLAPGNYPMYITDDNNCRFDFNFTINPGLDIQGNTFIDDTCLNDLPNANVTVTYDDTLINLADLTFDLDNGTLIQNGDNIFTSVGNGNHNVVITDNITGCQVQVNFTVNLANPLVLTLNGPGTLNTFTMSTTGGQPVYEYQIWNSAGTLLYTGTNTSYLVNQTDVYTVTVTDALGCTDTKSIPMTFYDIEIDNFFTPDGDGTNDGWSPQYLDNFPKAVTYIFDRYSRKIKTLRPGDTWDGTYKGNELPSGDYWYVLKLNGDEDDREFIGNVTLYR